MEVFFDDWIYGDFLASDYALTSCSFEYDGEVEDEVFAVDTTEEFIGENPNSVYTGQKYSFHLEGEITLMKNPCQFQDLTLSEYECRAVMRKLTGFRGYQWMKFLSKDEGEDIWYKARVTNVSYQRVYGKVVGIKVKIQTNSYLAYSREYSYKLNLEADKEFTMYINSDDLVNYTYPNTFITPKADGLLRIEALEDIPPGGLNPYMTEIIDAVQGRTIQLDGVNKLTSNVRLNDFNLHWPRFLPEKNVFKANMDCEVQFIYRLTRKVGFICR